MEKPYKRFFEMANIPSKKTGLSGIIQIRPEERHILFPHIHYVRDVKQAESEYIKVTLNEEKNKIKVIKNKNFKISKKEFELLKIFIERNFKKLETYYNQAEYIPDTSAYLSKFVKV
jgi:hypothetical protein